eukprot:11611707-Heterocapsa_arctica.AAC.1
MGVLLSKGVARRASAGMRSDFPRVERGKALRWAVRQLGLGPLRPCLFRCFHGGALCDRVEVARSLLE